MADEIFKPDANFKAGGLVGGVSSVDGSSKLVLRLNPTTKRLLVDVNGATTVTDGEAVDGTDVGTLVLGTDGSNYQILSTNSSGRLQVDIVSGGGGGTQYQEDAAHSSGDTGTLALAVRKDTAAQVAGTDGDYSVLITDANGRLHVLDQNSAAILSALQGTLTVNSELPAAAALADTTANPTVPGVGAYLMGFNGVTWDRIQAYYSNSDNLATLTGMAVLGLNRVFDGTNWDMMRGDSTDGVLVNLGANNDVTVTGTVTVGSHAVTNAGTFVVQENGSALTSLQLIDNIVLAEDQASANADPGVQMLAVRKATPANTSGLDGDYEPLQVSGGRLWVDPSGVTLTVGSHAVTNAGTFAVQIDGAALTALQLIDNLVLAEDAAHQSGDPGVQMLAVRDDTPAVLSATEGDYEPLHLDGTGRLWTDPQGNVAHDGVDSGNPIKFGGRAQESEAQPEEVADNDRVDALFDRAGYLRVRGDFDPSFADINDSTSGDNTIVAAQAAGKRIAVWAILIVSDGTTDVRWEDGAAGTAFTGQVPLQAREGYSISAGGIVPLFVGSAATLLNLELTAAVNVHGFVSYTVIDD